MKSILVVCTTDSMIWNFLVPHIKHLQSKGINVECACSKTGFFYEELENMGLILHEIPFERHPFKLKNVKSFFNLKNLISKKHYDLIQCHEPVGGALGRLTGKICKKKVMYFAHGFHFFKGAPKSSIIYYIIEKTLSFFTDDLITINNEDYLSALKFHAKRTFKIHGIGIDTSKFKKSDLHNQSDSILGSTNTNIFKIISVGELIPRKNHITIIKSLLYLPEDIHYFIVGDGDNRDYLISEAEKFRVSHRVHLMGFRKDVSAICNAADLFVFPSLQEGLSVALMEAMSIGLPIVASDIRGNNDLVNTDKGGFLVDPQDYKGFAKAILDLKNDPKKRENLGNYNQIAIKKYDIHTVLSEMDDIMMPYLK